MQGQNLWVAPVEAALCCRQHVVCSTGHLQEECCTVRRLEISLSGGGYWDKGQEPGVIEVMRVTLDMLLHKRLVCELWVCQPTVGL